MTITALGTLDVDRVILALHRKPLRYSQVKAMLGCDSERALDALDALLEHHVVTRVVIDNATHFTLRKD